MQPITVQQAYDGITNARRWASWNWWWRKVDDDDGDGFPSPEPRTESRLALPREFRAWRRLRIVKRDESFSLIFSSPKVNIWSQGQSRWSVRGATRQGARPGGRARPHPRGKVEAPLTWIFLPVFFIYSKIILHWFSGHSKNFYFCTKNNTMAILLKTASVRVSSIQIMQVRVQNKSKSVWKSRYDGDVSTPPSLNLCLSSSNSVDKLKVIKKNFYKLCLLLLL